MKRKLSSVPSKLIRQAVEDLIACEQDDNYAIEMTFWHTPSLKEDTNAFCEVCFAGAVMAKSIGLGTSEQGALFLRECSVETESKLRALDHFRVGNVDKGLMLMGSLPGAVDDFSSPEYKNDPEGFKSAMLDLADRLEKQGV